MGRSNVGWGTAFLDVEHRGWEDLVFVNGHTNRFLRGNVGWQQYPFLLRNEGDGLTAGRTLKQPPPWARRGIAVLKSKHITSSQGHNLWDLSAFIAL